MISVAEKHAGASPLVAGHFRKIAGHGFGDGHNSYAYSYAWFNNHLYIGTNRDILVLIRKRFRFEVPLAVWPVEVPDKLTPEDLRAEIWRYNPASGDWRRVYQSRITKGLEDRDVPLATGFRNMAVFKGKSDPAPAIYTIPSCGSLGIGPVLMRSGDGERFEEISEPGMGLGDPNVTSFRAVVPFKGKLFVTPAGSRGANPNVSYHALILCSDDPASGKWQVSSPRCFGDPTNVSIHEMAVSGDYLYAGTTNVRHGCQLWKTDAQGRPPHKWTKVFDAGADRGQFNQAVVSMAPFKNALYVGTGIQNGGHDRINNIGPAAGEVLRVYPDDAWELVTGDARDTRFGLQVPASGLGAGFDNPFAGYIWRMCEHDGVLYVGTFDSSSFLPFAKLDERAQRVLDRATMDRFLAARGGFDLWRSTNGDQWTPVTRNGFGNPWNFGVRALVSAPCGLFLGTANPFGPKVARFGSSGPYYETNPLGGVEVWQGATAHMGVRDDERPAWDLRKDAIRLSFGLEGDGADTFDPARIRQHVGMLPDIEEEDLVTTLTALSLRSRTEGQHQAAETAMARQAEDAINPLTRLVESDALDAADDEAGVEGELDRYFGSSMRFIGLWSPQADTPLLSCIRLVDEAARKLESLLGRGSRHSVLVIGVGCVEITRRIQQGDYGWSLELLTFAPNVERRAKATLPKLRVHRTRRGRFPRVLRGRFDATLWLDGPSSVPEGLSQAVNVLRAGGRFVGSDVLFQESDKATKRRGDDEDGRITPDRPVMIEAFRRRCERAGLADVEVDDLTREGWERFFLHSRSFCEQKVLRRQMSREAHDEILKTLPGGGGVVGAYVMVSAKRSW